MQGAAGHRRLVFATLVALLTLGVGGVARAHVEVHVHPASDFPSSSSEASADSPLPERWCGDLQSAADTRYEFGSTTLPKIKVVVAAAGEDPLDRRLIDWAQRHARVAVAHVRDESGGRKTLRFDLGTRCGPGYLDLMTV